MGEEDNTNLASDRGAALALEGGTLAKNNLATSARPTEEERKVEEDIVWGHGGGTEDRRGKQAAPAQWSDTALRGEPLEKLLSAPPD